MNSIAHGGRLSEALALFPNAPRPWLDLSTGINPCPYPLPPLETESFTRLPDPAQVAKLQAIAALAYGAPNPDGVVASPGTQILIDLLPRLWPCAAVAVVKPTYAEHRHAWDKASARVKDITALDQVGDETAVVLCNPNNPDGRRYARDQLLALADKLATRNGVLVIDEAFADLEDENLSLASASPHPALVILRSFGKPYGLAGLRLGFAITTPRRARHIREALGPWAVSGPAISIGQRALADRPWLAATAARLGTDVRALDACLSGSFLHVLGGTKLFRLAATTDAASVFSRLGQAGIFVRRFADHPTWLRFGQPGTAAALQRLQDALRR